MEVILPIVLLVVIIFVIRLFGAWMLRIDEVIKYQKEILTELRKMRVLDE
jgi:flagellar biosynthesis protein FliQ